MNMFSPTRKADPPPSPTAPPPPAPNGMTAKPAPTTGASAGGGILSAGVSIKGSVKFRNELVIDGKVEGEIDSGGRLTVGKNAEIRGEIRTRTVSVLGTVEGNITAGERCELLAGCTLKGDIEAPRLVVDENATFIGSAKISTPGKAA